MRFLLNNFWLKMLALVMGLLVWIHVATEKTYTYQLKLPVTHVELKVHHTLAALPPESLSVMVSARGKQLLQTAWRDQGVRINASKLLAGEYVLGTLDANEAQVVARAIETDAGLRDAVEAWEARLTAGKLLLNRTLALKPPQE